MTHHNAIKFIQNAPNEAPKDSSVSARIGRLLKALGNPQKRIKYIRLAGANGKTILARMLISILNKANIVNGCLSMPLYEELRDNIRINGDPISISGLTNCIGHRIGLQNHSIKIVITLLDTLHNSHCLIQSTGQDIVLS